LWLMSLQVHVHVLASVSMPVTI
jgi:hypothetical protein